MSKLTKVRFGSRPHLNACPRRIPASYNIHYLEIDRVIFLQHLANSHLDILKPGIFASILTGKLVVEACDVADEVVSEVFSVFGYGVPRVSQLEDLLDLVVGWVSHG